MPSAKATNPVNDKASQELKSKVRGLISRQIEVGGT